MCDYVNPTYKGELLTARNGYLGEIMRVSGLFHPKTQLNDALNES